MQLARPDADAERLHPGDETVLGGEHRRQAVDEHGADVYERRRRPAELCSLPRS
jgi:hypothetical protein